VTTVAFGAAIKATSSDARQWVSSAVLEAFLTRSLKCPHFEVETLSLLVE
jgi:hypothetical protein